MKKIGITGGIGSGKSYICSLFNKEFNIPIYNCDQVYKKIASTNTEVNKKIIDLLGDNAYTNPNADFKKLANLLFTNKKLLKQYDNIVFPYFMEDLNEFYTNNISYNYILIESAILFESGFDKLMDDVIVVIADENNRLNRVLKRNPNLNEADIKLRMDLQLPDNIKKDKAKYFIDNNVFDNNLISKIKIIHNNIIKKPIF